MEGEANNYLEPGDINIQTNQLSNFNKNMDNNQNNNNQNNSQLNTQNQNHNNNQNHNQNFNQNGYNQYNQYNQPNNIASYNQNYNLVNKQDQVLVQPVMNNQNPQIIVAQGNNPLMKARNGYYIVCNKNDLDYLINNPNISTGFNDPRHPESYRTPYYNFGILNYAVHTKCSNCEQLTYTNVLEKTNIAQFCYYLFMVNTLLCPLWCCYMACRNKNFCTTWKDDLGLSDYTYTCSRCSHVHKNHSAC